VFTSHSSHPPPRSMPGHSGCGSQCSSVFPQYMARRRLFNGTCTVDNARIFFLERSHEFISDSLLNVPAQIARV